MKKNIGSSGTFTSKGSANLDNYVVCGVFTWLSFSKMITLSLYLLGLK